MFDLLVQNGKRQIVGSVILSGRHVANGRVAGDSAAFRLDQHFKHGIHIARVGRKVSRRTCRDVMKSIHAVRELSAQLVNAGHQGFKVIAVFDARVFGDFLQPFTV